MKSTTLNLEKEELDGDYQKEWANIPKESSSSGRRPASLLERIKQQRFGRSHKPFSKLLPPQT
jgi:hypothetical protein